MPPEIFVPAESIDYVLDISSNVFSNGEELSFLKSCLFYLKEGMTGEQAVELAMVDFLIDL